jgi:hypothetical protein
MRPKTKELKIGEYQCRIGKLDACSAAWILSVLMAVVADQRRRQPQPAEAGAPEPPNDAAAREEMARGVVGALWLTAGSALDRERYRDVQQGCLRACAARNDGGLYEPIVAGDGRWSRKDIADDAPAVHRLILETLQFNLSPFFLDDASSGEGQAPGDGPRSAPPNASR